jgi:hypothetical protein
MGEVASVSEPEGVRALSAQIMPLDAMSATQAGLTPSVSLRVTAPPSRGSRAPTLTGKKLEQRFNYIQASAKFVAEEIHV